MVCIYQYLHVWFLFVKIKCSDETVYTHKLPRNSAAQRYSKNQNLVYYTSLVIDIISSFFTFLVHLTPEGVSLYLTSNTTLESATTVIKSHGVIVNHEYPFRYLSGELHLWEVIFNQLMYVNLVVFNVSFNQMQVSLYSNT